MRQVLQSLETGEILVDDIPCPNVRRGHLLIRTSTSLISAGTERMLLEFGKAGILEKSRQQPEKVRQVLQKFRTDGILPTLRAVRNKLAQPLAPGYCNVGTVIEVGDSVQGLKIGDRVVSNGSHAEVVCVPKNLCGKIPDGVPDEAAVFAVLGAIGLNGLRLAQPTLGESFVVSGLGLIGLLTVQLLRAAGCRALGLDYDRSRLELAATFGAETFDLSGGDPLDAAQTFSRGRGVDGVLLTASTASHQPIHQAAEMCRKRGRIVLVGVCGLNISRDEFYKKELSFQVSCSYGPGRYDPRYEEQGIDYPLGFVRWTEQRNFEAVLDLMAAGRIDARPLVSHRFPIERASQAYQIIGGKQPSLGVLLEYPEEAGRPAQHLRERTIRLDASGRRPAKTGAPVVAFVGAGNYASQVLIPAFRRQGACLHRVTSNGGLTAAVAARRFPFAEASSDLQGTLEDTAVDAVVIATRHDTHAQLACDALAAGKHVFVEKPLALSTTELQQILAAYQAAAQMRPAPLLTVGFNRRFAPHAIQMRRLLAPLAEPKAFIMTVNAGTIPADHWVHDPQAGGGRVIGEACHFVDLLRYLCGHAVVSVQSAMLGPNPALAVRDDKISFTLSFADGSIGTVHYLANGHRSFPKERLEVFCAGRMLQLDNFRRLTGWGWKNFRKMNLWSQDKGHAAEVARFLEAIQQGGPPPIPISELVEATLVTLDVVRAAESRQAVECVNPFDTFSASAAA